MEVRGGGPAQVDLAVLYESAEFFVDFLSVVNVVVQKFCSPWRKRDTDSQQKV